MSAPERRYRWLLSAYPPDRRRELRAVLLTGDEDGRWAPGVASSLDLIAGGLRMRLRSCSTARLAVRMMYLGALVELGTLITIIATLGDEHAAILQRYPHYTAAQWHDELGGAMLTLEIGAVIAIGVWLWLAWANGRGHRWARIGMAVFFAVTTLSLANGIATNAATYARADLVAGSLLWLTTLTSVALTFNRRSAPHYAA